MVDSDMFNIRALVEIIQEEGVTLVSSSPLLTAGIQSTTQRLVKIESNKDFIDVPSTCIRGRDASVVGKEVVEMYSRYIAGLFENFDLGVHLIVS
jgi:hypothetical protein